MKSKIYICVLVLCAVFSSCATRKHVEYVDREVVKYQTKVQHDTVTNYVRDSIYHTILQKGDTVYDTKYIEKIKYKEKEVYVYDTIYRDSIQTVFEEKTTIKKVIPKWCYFCLLVCAICVIFAINKAIRWLR